MELLKEIHEKDVDVKIYENESFQIRKAARAVLFNQEGKIAILHVSSKHYHKIPGGGIDDGENIQQALAREVKEETGCSVSVSEDVGVVIEYKNKQKKIQISYCYLAKVDEEGECNYTEKEQSQGFRLLWMDFDEAIKVLENDKTGSYTGNFILARDLEFLKRAKSLRGG